MSVEWDPTWTREERMRLGPQSGPGWHLETATSAFFTDDRGRKVRFKYVVLEGPCIPWSGLDDLRVERGWISRADVEAQDQ